MDTGPVAFASSALASVRELSSRAAARELGSAVSFFVRRLRCGLIRNSVSLSSLVPNLKRTAFWSRTPACLPRPSAALRSLVALQRSPELTHPCSAKVTHLSVPLC